jgi:4-amino-4-deoxy-L-arabinose transferase-like glycosyltransferase
MFAVALGLGVDESYMVAAGRTLQVSYFDHPPIAWWLPWAAAHLAGSESALVVRLPFIALFAVSTWLMYQVTSVLFGAEAGLWAAVALNLAPVFGISTATWVLPDGPLVTALLAATACLIAVLPASGRTASGRTASGRTAWGRRAWGQTARGRTAWGWWLGAGICAGLALCSKYSAALSIIGAIGFLLTEPNSRRWLARPQPYLAGLIAVAIFLPVLIWNAEHEWVSFLFQGGRAGGRFHPLGVISTLAGEAAFLLPWIWIPLVVCGVIAARRGPQDAGRWLWVCLSAPPLILFTVASLWGKVLFHWAAPGYLMLLPLLGEATARHWRRSRAVRVGIAASAALVVAGTAGLASEIKFDWLPAVIGEFPRGKDPARDIVDWTSLRRDLVDRGLLERPGLIVAALRWSDAGKIDYALGGTVPVICLGPDAHQYGLIARHDDYAGADVLIVTPVSFEKVVGQFWFLFDWIEPIAPTTVLHAGHPALKLNLFLGHGLHKSAEECCAS